MFEFFYLTLLNKHNKMQTILIKVSNRTALTELKSMQTKNLIRIVEPNMESLALPGKEITLDEFKKWIKDAEKSKTISLQQAQKKWQAKKEKLQALIR